MSFMQPLGTNLQSTKESALERAEIDVVVKQTGWIYTIFENLPVRRIFIWACNSKPSTLTVVSLIVFHVKVQFFNYMH